MDLATLQRRLRDAIKGRAAPAEELDPYLAAVVRSPSLAVMQEIAVWWRTVGVERSCALTARALKRRFDEAVAAFVRGHAISPYRDELGPSFLAAMDGHDDPLIAAVARFELALVMVKRGDPGPHVIDWGHEPYAVLGALIQGRPFDEERARGSYQTIVSPDLPRLFRVTKNEGLRSNAPTS